MEMNSTPSVKKLSKEEFFKFIDEEKIQRERIYQISYAGLPIWDSDVIEYGILMFARVIESYFTQEGSDWVFWWLYEKDGDPDMKAWDEDNNEIPMETVEDLWNCIKQYRK